MGELMKLFRNIDPKVLARLVPAFLALKAKAKNEAFGVVTEGDRETFTLSAELESGTVELRVSYPRSERAKLGV
jgi:hypothetical protein